MFGNRIVATMTAAAALFAATATAAHAGPDDYAPATADPAVMAGSIQSALAGNTVGFAYVIAKNGQYAAGGAGGKARTGPDGNATMTTTTRMEIASATKNITAAAVLKLLEANALTLEHDAIWWLPTQLRLTAHESWGNVTFRHLLRHTSGLEQLEQGLSEEEAKNWTTRWPGLAFAVTKEITAGSAPAYSNMNYAMLRIIIPQLWRAAHPNDNVPVVTSTNSGPLTLAYVNKYLLGPAGIATAACVPANAATAALTYNANNIAAGGYLYQLVGQDAEACAGHRGLHLSAMDLARWQAHLAHGNVVSDTVRTQMDTGRLGWRGSSNTAAYPGIYFHDGDLALASGQQVHTCHAKFPGNIEASAIINSQNLGGDRVCDVLANAFAAAS